MTNIVVIYFTLHMKIDEEKYENYKIISAIFVHFYNFMVYPTFFSL